MKKAHELAALSCPDGVTSHEALGLLIDIQMAACRAIGLEEDLPLLTGDYDDVS